MIQQFAPASLKDSDTQINWIQPFQDRVLAKALELGLSDVGFTSIHPPETGSSYLSWLESGMNAELHYLARNQAKRLDPTQILPGARSMLVALVNYAVDSDTQPELCDGSSTDSHCMDEESAVLARYSRYTDYHDSIGERLKELGEFMDQEFLEYRRGLIELDRECDDFKPSKSLWYVDTGPILEREYASRAGLGFVGKHTGLISRKWGNWTFIGEIITQIPFEGRMFREPNRCGNCSRCLDICPTQAFPEPFRLDARKCISYWTIENKGPIPLEMREKIGDRIFGCDECLAVCPWNRFARESSWIREFRWAEDRISESQIVEWLRIEPGDFKKVFANTPVLRSKRKGFLRNLCVVAGNLGMKSTLPELERLRRDPEPLIAEHANWALSRIEEKCR